jgi:hypothetical protein
MSQNLNLLRQQYCHPATLSGKKTHYLFPLEKECGQGKALLAKVPETLHIIGPGTTRILVNRLR